MPQTWKIFIADDDNDILEILQLMLKAHGFEPTVSNDPAVIFSYEKKELPDLILLDIWLNGIDGRDVCLQLKENPATQNIPVVFVSANSSIEEITKECAADAFIAKPFEMKHLIKVIKEILPEN